MLGRFTCVNRLLAKIKNVTMETKQALRRSQGLRRISLLATLFKL
jgi:hypothetical protein